jgi:hypothetical protein
MELPREQMQIYEPASYHGSHDDLLNSLDGDSWGDSGSFDDLPSIDINAADDPPDDSFEDSDFKTSPGISYQSDDASERSPGDAGAGALWGDWCDL